MSETHRILDRLRSVRLRAWHLAGAVLVALLLDFLLTGIWVVESDQCGVLLRFGRHVRTCPSGIHFTLPYPIERMEIVETTAVRTMPVGFKHIDRVRGIGPAPEEVQWLTGDTNIVEIQAVVQYTIKDPAAYLFDVADLSIPDAGFPESRHRNFILRKATESVLTGLVARMWVDDVLSSGKAWLQEEARQGTQMLIDEIGLGIQVRSINILDGSPPAEVIAAFNEVSSAKADKVRAVSEADGYRLDLLPRARAEANRVLQEAEVYRSEVVNTAHGAARRFRDLWNEVKAAPEVSVRRLWLEKIEEALTRARLVVYPRKPGSEFVLTEIE